MGLFVPTLMLAPSQTVNIADDTGVRCLLIQMSLPHRALLITSRWSRPEPLGSLQPKKQQIERQSLQMFTSLAPWSQCFILA